MIADTRPFLDTNVLIYAHDTSAGRKHEIARALVSDLWNQGGGALSVQVLQELYVTLTRKVTGMAPAAARDLTAAYGRWRVHRPEATDVLAAIDLHERIRISFWDAMVVHSAATLGCERLLSEDLNADQVIAGVRVVDPFANG